APAVEQAAVARQQGGLDIFQRAHRPEGGRRLEGAAYALAPDPLGRQADQFAPGQLHRPGIRPHLAVDRIEAGRLARAVGADEGQHLAGGQRERHVVERADAAERFAQAAHLQQRRVHGRAPAPRAARLARPPGNAITSANTATPSTACQYSVNRAALSCSQVYAAAPTSGPASACTPPSSTITSPSTERPT